MAYSESIDETHYQLGLRKEEILGKLRRWSPDVVFINIPSFGWCNTAFDVASLTKQINKNIVTVLIGLHPSVRPMDCLKHPLVDLVIIGEPEVAAVEVVIH